MKKLVITFIVFQIFSSILIAQANLLRSGPMVGYSEMREVMLWVQTHDVADVKIAYWIKDSSSVKEYTNVVSTEKKSAFTAHLMVDILEPGLTYEYELYINGKVIQRSYPLEFKTQVLWHKGSDPPNFSFAFGSGAFINEAKYDKPRRIPTGGDYEIYEAIFSIKPDFMIWGGDNLYLRKSEYYSWTGILHRNSYHREQEYLQALWGSIHHYAIWDDHDYGPDNSNRSFVLKEKTLEAFKLFWANPTYGINGKPGITTYFEWGDVAFFLMDNRYYRTPNKRETTNREIFGAEQVEWLLDGLVSSKAPFKFIVTGNEFLTDNDYEENHINFNEERERILSLIKEEGIEGVIFLTGDRHFSELSKLEREGAYPIYDFTISPFTSGVNLTKMESNSYRVEGSYIAKRNFAIFELTGERKKRELKCSVYDKDGKKLWEYKINETELK
ncbi:MAG: alkaline phosphatase family protein [Melioribacteraceae bacterium]|nr:alkaline phosphatase family protein [Melioribacteraceae bacterium]